MALASVTFFAKRRLRGVGCAREPEAVCSGWLLQGRLDGSGESHGCMLSSSIGRQRDGKYVEKWWIRRERKRQMTE